MSEKKSTKVYRSQVGGSIVGHDMNITNIIMFRNSEREFFVTHKANINPTSYFTGREVELSELRQRVEEGCKSVLVSGMGGIGKTHICRKLLENYLKQHSQNENIPFQHIGYIEYEGDMNRSLLKCLKYKEQEQQKDNQEAAWRELEYLASDGKLLLIVDNVDKPIRSDPGLHKLKEIPGTIVLTSRRTSFGKEFELYRIGFLDIEQCKEIYERIRYGRSTEKVLEEEILDLEYIIDTLAARHTITIEFLADLAATKCWNLKRLREELQDKGFCLEYKDDEEKLVNIQKSYEILYDMSVLTEAEQNILEAFSVFPYIPLPAETCNQWLLADAWLSEDYDILMGLYRKGWLQFDVDQEGYALHPVFAQFIYEKCKPEIHKHRGLVAECRKSLKVSENGFSLESQNYIPFAENIIDKMYIKDVTEKIGFLTSLAYLMQYIGEYRKAGNYYKQLIEIHERTSKASRTDIAIDYQNLAYIFLMQKEYKEAEKLCNKSINLLNDKNRFNAASLIIATNYNNLAFIYQAQKRYSEAEDMYKESIKIQKKVLGEKNGDIVQSYNNLAYLYECQKQYGEAEKLYKKSLQINKEVSEKENLNTAVIYNNLAKLYEEQGKHKYAFVYFFVAYKILFLKFGTSNPRTQISYKNMKFVYKILNPEGNFEQWLEKKMKE